MKIKFTCLLIAICCFLIRCKNTGDPVPQEEKSKITSAQYIDKLLFVDTNGFQIQTSEPATFSTTDPRLQMTPAGYITRLTTGEIAAIDITWTGSGEKTRIYALGARGDNYDDPNASYNGETATDSYQSYIQGWKMLQKLPVANENYVVVLRHADASIGKDFSLTTGPANWWKSMESTQARQLNEQGKQRSSELGKIFKDLNISFERVITSEFYRARQTAELINAGPAITTIASINHPSHNNEDLFKSMQGIVNGLPADKKITLIVSHHPINEVRKNVAPGFPPVIPFPWTGAYLIKINNDKTLTYEGAITYPMFKYWRDMKFNKL